jgi:hypothetical protein
LALTIMRPCARAEEARLLDEAGAGVVAVNTETRVRVDGIEGQLSLARGAAGELEFRSEAIDKEGVEVPVALRTDGETFRFEPPQGRATIPARLSLSIPPGMRIRLELEGAKIIVLGVDGELAAVGRQLRVEAQNLLKPALFEVEGGEVKVYGATKGVTIRGRDLDVVLERISGRTDLRLKGGTAKLTGLQSGLQGDFTGTSVAIDTIIDSASARFDKGKAQITRLRDGGDFVLTGCPLRLAETGGNVSVTSDGPVQFSDCKASLHIENSAGAIVGVRHDGRLEITTHGAQVALGQIQGQLRVAGDRLDVRLEQIGATVFVVTTASSVSLDVATGAVTVENDGGDVTVKRTDGSLDLKARGGNVHLEKLRGPVTVQADGDQVDVDWEVLPSSADSKIVNDGGSVTVRFPLVGDSRVEATSRSRIENNLSKVVVEEDGGSAQGVVGGGGSGLKTILIQAAGDVTLLGPETQETSEPSGEAP